MAAIFSLSIAFSARSFSEDPLFNINNKKRDEMLREFHYNQTLLNLFLIVLKIFDNIFSDVTNSRLNIFYFC